jgi:hypothetical protein
MRKRYNTQYKKRIAEKDPYLPRGAAGGMAQCASCGAFSYKGRWSVNPPPGSMRPSERGRTVCPACRKIREHYPGGELYLLEVQAADRKDLAAILRNEEKRARLKNPLERIMRMQPRNGGWRVETSTEKLAQRLGRSVKKARGGRLVYKWGHQNKFVRIEWRKAAVKAERGRSS